MVEEVLLAKGARIGFYQVRLGHGEHAACVTKRHTTSMPVRDFDHWGLHAL